MWRFTDFSAPNGVKVKNWGHLLSGTKPPLVSMQCTRLSLDKVGSVIQHCKVFLGELHDWFCICIAGTESGWSYLCVSPDSQTA